MLALPDSGGAAATQVTVGGVRGRYAGPMVVQITIARVSDRYTFLINGRGDVVFDPVWGLTTFSSPEAAREAAEDVIRVIAGVPTLGTGPPVWDA